jgi:hypothetical protein
MASTKNGFMMMVVEMDLISNADTFNDQPSMFGDPSHLWVFPVALSVDEI